jgi:hypothetical protein
VHCFVVAGLGIVAQVGINLRRQQQQQQQQHKQCQQTPSNFDLGAVGKTQAAWPAIEAAATCRLLQKELLVGDGSKPT